MSKKIQFQIHEPCHENWQKMTPVEQGKFCVACNKTVIDFSLMTNEEILQQISRSSGNVCGRFMPEQLKRDIHIDAARGTISLKYIWNMLFAGLLISSHTTAQTKPLQGKVRFVTEPMPIPQTREMAFISIPAPVQQIRLRVVDAEDNSPVSFASIALADHQGGFATDSNGNIYIPPGAKLGNGIEISSIGYESRIVPITEFTGSSRITIIPLQRAGEKLSGVEVIASSGKSCTGMMEGILGGMFAVRKVTTVEKIKDTVATVFSRNPVRVFPNPVLRGGIVHVQFGLDRPGNYKMEIINSSGQVLKSETITITVKNHVKQFFIENSFASGVYFARMKGEIDKKVYQSKFVVR
jgi:hypothetical protein